MKNFIESVLDFVFPPRCGVCGEFMDEKAAACPGCLEGFERVTSPMCTICGDPFQSGIDHPCGGCSDKLPPFDMLRSAGKYKGSMKRAIVRYKFNKSTALVGPFGEMMVATFREHFASSGIDVIMPVPLHVKRLRWRGFNQSLLLAREISKATGIEVDALTLKRIRHTRPQTRLPHKERPDNVKGAFAVERPNFAKERSILIVDDMATTLSTIKECASILKKAGASKVFVITAARAVPDFSDGD